MNQPVSAPPDGALRFSGLTKSPSRAQLAGFKRWARTQGRGSARPADVARSLFVIILVSFFLGVSGMLAVGFAIMEPLMATAVTSGRLPLALSVLFQVVVVAVFVFLWVRLIDIWRRDVRFGPKWRRWLRFEIFAEDNGMFYEPEILFPNYSGSIFALGQRRRASDIFSTRAGRYVQIGNYEYSGQSRFNRSLNRRGYILVTLDRAVPHLYLRSRKSKKFGETFARKQEFGLEGDFGKYFRLYAPGGYERDALYILTPDLMALLVDEAAGFDVEFVGASVYFYSPTPFSMTDPNTFVRSARLSQQVVPKALRQTMRYSDDRVVGNRVGARGAQLNRGLTFFAVLGVLYGVAQLVRIVYVLFFR